MAEVIRVLEGTPALVWTDVPHMELVLKLLLIIECPVVFGTHIAPQILYSLIMVQLGICTFQLHTETL